MTLTLLLATLMIDTTTLTAAAEVVYSARNEQLIKLLFERYTRDNGVQIKFITGAVQARFLEWEKAGVFQAL